MARVTTLGVGGGPMGALGLYSFEDVAAVAAIIDVPPQNSVSATAKLHLVEAYPKLRMADATRKTWFVEADS